jgi:hypothetical protein
VDGLGGPLFQQKIDVRANNVYKDNKAYIERLRFNSSFLKHGHFESSIARTRATLCTHRNVIFSSLFTSWHGESVYGGEGNLKEDNDGREPHFFAGPAWLGTAIESRSI